MAKWAGVHGSILGEEILPSIRIQPSGTFYIMRRSISLMRHSISAPQVWNVTRGQFAGISAESMDDVRLQGWGRIDVMLDSDGQFYLLEPIPHRV